VRADGDTDVDQITFYRDQADTFKCEVAIQGAELNESRVRLVLSFDNGNSYLFNGRVSANGMCEINVPKLKEEDGAGGTATLEVIAESAFFEPWQGSFAVRSRRAVQVEGVQVSTDTKKKVLVKNVGGTEPSKDRKIVESILKTYDPKSRRIIAELDDYEPTKKVKDWGRRVFKSKVDTRQARYCMMVLEERMRKINKR
jgi:hypothetical protein